MSVERARAFFAPRAPTWDDRFPDDDAAFARAVTEMQLAPGARVVDLGCGTGRALPRLRAAVGDHGTAIGLDVTMEMLNVARNKQRGTVMLADATTLPLRARSVDGIFAAGLVTHVPDASPLLRELARVAKPATVLAIFHPIGRAALAARHQRVLAPGELLDPSILRGVLADAGWRAERVDDADDRYLALARKPSE